MFRRTLAVAALATSLTACIKDHPRVTYDEVQSEAEGRAMPYAVYTPPGWDGQTRLPLVVFLHGGGDDERVLERHPVVTRILDRWIEEGTLPPFIMVAPKGERGFWRNWADGSHRYGDYVMNDVVGDMYANYPLIPEEEGGMHLMGISMGGAGSLFLGLDHLDRIASFTVWSAPIFTAEEMETFIQGRIAQSFLPIDRVFGELDRAAMEKESPYTRITSADDLRGTTFLFGAGTTDIFGIPKASRQFEAHLDSHGVPHRYVVYKGGHRWPDWARVFPVALCLHLSDGTCELPESRFYTMSKTGDPDRRGTAGSVGVAAALAE